MKTLPLCLALTLAAPALAAAGPSAVDAALKQRFEGDRTGACAVAAIIDGDRVERGMFCADASRRIGPDVAFEIGSVSKTVTGALLAGLIAEDRVTLDTPLADVLPSGTTVPSFVGQPITLRHLLSHTAGLPALPPGFAPANMADPYADLTESQLLDALGKVQLAAAPGSAWAYSNFGAMLLSAAVSRIGGEPFPELARQRVFAPLGMDATHVGSAPAGVVDALGHRSSGDVVPGWTFAAALAGVGGVRSPLDDMVRYVQAQLGQGDDATVAMLQAAQAPLDNAGQPMAMGWMIAPFNDRDIFVHEGGTFGFSSFVAFDREAGRGVVVLADTALTDLGGLADIGLPLLDPSVPMGAPRRLQSPPQALLERMAGDFLIGENLPATLRQRDGALYLQAAGQPEFKLAYDSEGDFFPEAFDALLTPAPDGQGFTLMQGGGAMSATRVDSEAKTPSAESSSSPPAADAAPLADFTGSYPLMPGFALRVFAEGGQLRAQATGQGAFALDAGGPDRFTAAAFGIVLRFVRDEAGRVERLELDQGGQTLGGARE